MCGECKGEPYRGVRALFNADFQVKNDFEDRSDWTVVSPKVVVYLGASALPNEAHPLYRACDVAIESLNTTELTSLATLGTELDRPVF